jgi:hypothetical protein
MKNTEIVKKVLYLSGVICIVLVVILTVYTVKMKEKNESMHEVIFQENFSEGVLNPQTWQITREGDFKESIIDVYDVDPTENVEYRLLLRMNTIGTKDDTVKFHGVRSLHIVNFSDGKEISFDLDWNNQSNGCYLTASLYLCPAVTNGNPGDENDWLKFEYVGVPPGRNARGVVAAKSHGKVKYLYTEGWPEQRTGRHIAYQRIEIILDDKNKSLKIINYPAREIYFDNVVIGSNGLS